MRDSVLFYRSFYEAVKDLPPEEFKKSVCAIMNYGLDELAPDTTGIEKSMYIMAKPQIDANNRRYENSKRGGRKPSSNQDATKAEPNDNQDVTESDASKNQTVTNPVPKEKDKVKEKVKVNDKESKAVRFAPPTAQDVSAFCKEKGFDNFDVERFIDFYASKGWMVGKNKMKDWKAAVRNWVRQDKATNPGKPPKPQQRKNSFTNYPQRSYDYSELERQLLNSQQERKSWEEEKE